MTMRRKSGDRLRWALAYLLLGGVCCVMGVGLAESDATQQQRDAGAAGAGARGEDGALDTDRDPDYFVREDEVPQGLPPLQEEHAYFAALDLDHDGVLNTAEFKKHLAALDLDGHDIDAMSSQYGKNLTLGMTVGKVWVELHGSDSSDSAFAEIDANSDKKLTWDEWVHEMFHDQPQEPLFVDGEDGDIFTEELMLSFDKNSDKHLTLDEVRAFVGKHMRREDVDPDYTGRQAEVSKSKQGGMGMSYLFMIEFDSNHDNKVSVQEWIEGFQGQREQEEEKNDARPVGDALLDRAGSHPSARIQTESLPM